MDCSLASADVHRGSGHIVPVNSREQPSTLAAHGPGVAHEWSGLLLRGRPVGCGESVCRPGLDQGSSWPAMMYQARPVHQAECRPTCHLLEPFAARLTQDRFHRLRSANAKLLTAHCEDRRDDVHRMDADWRRRTYLSLNDRHEAEGLFLADAQDHAPMPPQVIFGSMHSLV